MNERAQLYERLTQLDAIERSAREGTLHALLAELDGGVRALGASAQAEALRAIRSALRIDLAFLTEHPEEAFACLHNRLAWHRVREAVPYYQLQRGQLVQQAPAGRDIECPPLQQTVRGWRAARDAGGVPWLRSLRPPQVALGGALLEEYRADAPLRFRRLRLDPSLRRIELMHGPRDTGPANDRFAARSWNCIAWDRVTGQRLDDSVVELRDSEVAMGGELRIEHLGWGEAVLCERTGGKTLGRLSLSDDRSASAVAYSADGSRVALCGYNEDDWGFVAVYELRTRALLWHAESDSPLWDVALSSRGDRVAASGSSGVQVWEVGTERPIVALPLRAAVVAFAPDDRSLLTAELGVVRVWDLDRATAFLRDHWSGLTNAAFSPNGTRLITGSWLLDARTGAVIANLDFRRIRYLEGGPPRNAFVLGDERVVCLELGVTVWDACTGAKRLRDESRGYWLMHVVALTADGTRYAIAHDASRLRAERGRVAILEVDSGAEQFAFDAAGPLAMAWDAEARLLAIAAVDGQVHVHDVHRDQLVRSFTPPKAAARDLASFLPSERPASPWRFERRSGCLALVRGDTGAVVAWLPALEDMVAHPSEPIWAGGPIHVRLEAR